MTWSEAKTGFETVMYSTPTLGLFVGTISFLGATPSPSYTSLIINATLGGLLGATGAVIVENTVNASNHSTAQKWEVVTGNFMIGAGATLGGAVLADMRRYGGYKAL